MEQFSAERRLTTVNIDRRGYGRRYSWLPVDTLSRSGFAIDCTGAYMRPEQFDIQPGDIVRWYDESRHLQAHVTTVAVDGLVLRAVLDDAIVLPPEFFAP